MARCANKQFFVASKFDVMTLQQLACCHFAVSVSLPLQSPVALQKVAPQQGIWLSDCTELKSSDMNSHNRMKLNKGRKETQQLQICCST